MEIDKLRAYFKGLKTPQKKEFIHKLQQKIKGVSNSKYSAFLNECTRDYNQELQSSKQKAEVRPDLTAELFAKAFAAMLGADKTKPSGETIGRRIAGKWHSVAHEQFFYYYFNDDGTFETNDSVGAKVLKGHYSTGMDGALLIEPQELVRFSSLMLSGNGNSLTIGLPDGSLHEYARQS